MHPLFSATIVAACLLRNAVAVPPMVSPEANITYPNCFPFEDPKCCVNTAVCQCDDGTFWPVRAITNTVECNPPRPGAYGDATKIPGWCC